MFGNNVEITVSFDGPYGERITETHVLREEGAKIVECEVDMGHEDVVFAGVRGIRHTGRDKFSFTIQRPPSKPDRREERDITPEPLALPEPLPLFVYGELRSAANPRKYKWGQPHVCHALQCEVPVKPEMFMCPRHWRMVPKHLQRRIWATYRPGQCDDKNPSRAYLETARQAIWAVSDKEGLTINEK